MKKLIASFVLTGALLSSPIVGSAALGDQTLKSGMYHSDVKQLQESLKKKGYFTNKSTTTYFGPITKNAVIKFQKAKGLKADGIAGKNTYKALGKQTSQPAVQKKSSIVTTAKKYVNVPYKWGGMSPKGFDCSGYLNYVLNESAGKKLPRTVADIYKQGVKVSSPKAGDLVFFETYKKGASHAGIYIGNNQFIHSSSSKGVTITSMNNSYWSDRYLGAKKY
ncbi:C40 family peptidase [Peribacillus frigoritolerans]|uniref:C40 family peptidase n=1 Tax=Peribacillus frigoritolerans TaxID=450367 RepID=UPI001059A584|nr:NlpC/P60 family protein [Peribacillus frigoritolerans]TDL82734.1 endopeptidase [Peribacillus frigoritolerans]